MSGTVGMTSLANITILFLLNTFEVESKRINIDFIGCYMRSDVLRSDHSTNRYVCYSKRRDFSSTSGYTTQLIEVKQNSVSVAITSGAKLACRMVEVVEKRVSPQLSRTLLCRPKYRTPGHR